MRSSADAPGSKDPERRFLAYDRTILSYRQIPAASTPRAVFVIVHGMGEHGGRYLRLASFLRSEGFAVYLPDLRGFGRSGGKRGCLRHFEDYFSDLDGLMSAIQSEFGDKKIFWLGHSYGGLISAEYLASGAQAKISGLVLSSPNFGLAVAVPKWIDLFAPILAKIFPDLTQSNRVRRDRLSHDPEITAERAKDPLIHDRISVGLYSQLRGRMARAGLTAGNLTLPTVIYQASDDAVVSRHATERFYEDLASPDKELQIIENAYHEILQENSRTNTFHNILRWTALHL